MSDALKIGKETLKMEAEAILRAEQGLSKSFEKSVEIIHNISGKLIVTGLGKSGHIARKIAATMASTGTSAFYLHPSEALHGDFGMLQEQDCVLAIAYGGETREVVEVAKFTKKINIPCIAITGNLDSNLARLSDIVLDGSVEREACPQGIAPTSSSTLALALGDALAMSLMDKMGFDREKFAKFHPEGSLGQKLSRVKDKMIALKSVLQKDACFEQVVDSLMSDNLGIAAFVDKSHRLIACFTDGDLRRLLLDQKDNCFTTPIWDFVTTNPLSIGPDSFVMEADELMKKYHVTSLFVVDENDKLLGLIKA